jgi:hypothetical protein
MNVLVIPEDFRKDEAILLPLIKAMFNAAGKPRANVRICKEPLLGGVDQALDSVRINEIVERYRGMVKIFILCVDRDGEDGRRFRLDQLEGESGRSFGENSGKAFFAENAWQELEVWILAGFNDLPQEWNWNEIRQERDPKERFYLPFARLKNVLNSPADGRKALAEEAATHFDRICQFCPEDFNNLFTRISNWLGAYNG